MPVWVRDHTHRLVSLEPNLHDCFKSDIEDTKMDEIINQQSLQDRCYPVRTTQPSCIRILAPNVNNFELNDQVTTVI